MRITSQTFYSNTLSSIERGRGTISTLTQELATGKKVSKPSDGPVAFASAQRLQVRSQSLSQYNADNANLGTQLKLGSATLNATLTTLDNVRTIALQAVNGSTSSGNRAALAKQVASAKQQLLGLANTESGSGRYLFAGTRGSSRPFAQDASGQVSYHGDGGGGATQVGLNQQVISLLSGSVFASVPQGNGYGSISAAASNTGTATATLASITDQSAAASFRRSGSSSAYNVSFSNSASGLQYTISQGGSTVSSGAFSPGMSLQIGSSGMTVRFDGAPASGDQFTLSPSRQQSVFDTLDNLSSAMQQALGSGAQRAQANQKINAVLSNLDQARTSILSQQSTIGVSLRAINTATNSNNTAQNNDQQAISSAVDANIPKVITALNQHQTALTAAMKAFGSVSQLSLFKYL